MVKVHGWRTPTIKESADREKQEPSQGADR